MYQYAFRQWLFFFYIYCVLGWIYESCLVSVKQKKWTNRGFMKGPWLPIYGSGAVVILFCTLPFKAYPVAVFFVGMLAATTMEYFTGATMVKLFKVRYWDYSRYKIQLHGHICLVASFIWGGFSLLMDYVIHKPIEKLVLAIPGEVLSVITFVITVVWVYDFANAFRDAMDLRAMIIQMEALKKQLDETIAEKKEEFSESVAEKKAELAETVAQTKAELASAVAETKEQLAKSVEESRIEYARKREDFQESIKLSRNDIENRMALLRERMDKPGRRLLKNNPSADFTSLGEEAKKLREYFRRPQ